MWTIGLRLHSGLEQSRRIIDGVLRYVAGHHDLQVRDFNFSRFEPELSEYPPWRGRADGVVAHVCATQGHLEWLKTGGVPVVNACADYKDELVSVYTDSLALAKLAADHLATARRRSIVYIGYRIAPTSHYRLRALDEVISKRGLKLVAYETETRLLGTCDDFATLADAEPELVCILRDTPKPMAVMALNDRWAVSVCRIVKELGLAVPDDVSILGVEDLELARLASPTISSVRTDGARIGYEAAQLLHRMLRGERLPRRNVQVPPLELVARESTIGRMRAGAADVEMALDYIRAKACDGIRNEDVANHVYVSLRTLEVKFASVVGHTVGEEIRNVRLARAKHLLETTDLPMSRVADMVGLSSSPALTSYLRRWADTTPNAYRQSHRQK